MNIVFAGTTIVSDSGTTLVFAIGNATEFIRLARLTQKVPLQPSPLHMELRWITRVTSVIAIGMGVIFSVLGILICRTFCTWLS